MVGAILVPVALGIGAACVVPWMRALVASDRCLDPGGSYDYKTEICIGTPSPLSDRFRADRLGRVNGRYGSTAGARR